MGAFAAFNREGLAGRVRYTEADPVIDRRMMSPGAAWILREILEANPRPGYGLGTFDIGSRPRVAWKTGTSYGFRDAWAIGGTRRYTVGVWVGRPDGTPLPGQYGAVTALPLMFEVIDSLPRTRSDGVPSPPPANVAEIGDLLAAGSAAGSRRAATVPATDEGVDAGRRGAADFRRTRRAPLECRPRALRSGCEHRLAAFGGMHASRTRRMRAQIARWPALASPWLSAQSREASRAASAVARLHCRWARGLHRIAHRRHQRPRHASRARPAVGTARGCSCARWAPTRACNGCWMESGSPRPTGRAGIPARLRGSRRTHAHRAGGKRCVDADRLPHPVSHSRGAGSEASRE